MRTSGSTKWAGVACSILAALVAFNGFAQSPATKEPEAVKPIVAEPHAIREVKAGTITAIVDLGRENAIYSPGSSVFASVKLSSAAPKGEEVVIAVEAEGAEIVSLTAKGGRIDDSQPRKTVRVLVRGAGETQLVIEIKMTDVAPRTVERPEARLKLAISTNDPRQAATTREATFAWAVADCAGSFHRQLANVRKTSLDSLPAALKTARSPDPAVPPQWLFPDQSQPVLTVDPRKQGRPTNRPEAVERVSIEYTVETVEERVCQSKNSSGDCIVWGTRSVQKRVPVDPFAPQIAGMQRDIARQEKAVLALADQLVRTKGAISDLASTGRFAWVTSRVSADLKTFAGQPLHPAICTGSAELLDYFNANLVALGKQSRSLQEAARISREIAAIRVEAFATASTNTETAQLTIAENAPVPKDRPLKALALDIAGRLLPAADSEAVRQADTPIRMLAILKARLDALPSTAIPDGYRRLGLAALRAIEAAARIELAERNFTGVDASLIGSITAIKSAHAKTCVCDGDKP